MTNEELVRNIKQGNASLMGELYEQNRRFIYSVVKKNVTDPNDYDDAMQDAYFGLVEAVNGFDERLGYKFLTYAKYYIQKSIQRGQSNALHVPEYIRVTARKIRRMQNKLSQELNRTPTAAELSKYTGLDVDTIRSTLAAAKRVKSIYEPLAEDLTIGDTIEDKNIDFENEIADKDEQQYISEVLRAAVRELPERERAAIECCYFEGMTYKQAGDVMGVSLDYVRQLINRALRCHLRNPRISRMLLDEELDRRTSFYDYVSVNTFNRTWTSATEYAVIDRERIRRKM